MKTNAIDCSSADYWELAAASARLAAAELEAARAVEHARGAQQAILARLAADYGFTLPASGRFVMRDADHTLHLEDAEAPRE